jgi:hypothetical protein
MRAHVIAACVTAAVLSSGIAPALEAQKPVKKDTVGLAGPGAGNQAQLDELKKAIDALRSRVADLEKEVAKGDKSDGSAPKMGAKFQAPFTILDEKGKSIFSVTDDPYSTGFRGRVHISPGSSGNNYNIWMHSADGTLVAAMGESNGKAGLVSVLRSGQDAGLLSPLGLEIRNTAGKQLAHIGLDPQNKERARVAVRGILQLYDQNFNTVVDAGALDDGRGAVRTWPNADCRSTGGLVSPPCLRGVK